LAVPVAGRAGLASAHGGYNLPVSSAPTAPVPPAGAPSGARKALAGFLLAGFLLAFLGAILPAWGYDREPANFLTVGNYFLCVALGLATSFKPARYLMARRGLSFLLVFTCVLAGGSLVYLAIVSPPVSAWWRAPGMLALGLSAGMLSTALFQAISWSYHADAARAITTGGIWFGLGCLGATLVAIGAFNGYNVAATLAVMAVAPLVFAAIYYRSSYAATDEAQPAQPTMRQAFADFRSLGAVLFALLLFFQSGNEWAIAGWLPLLLIRRVGMSPEGALRILACYWIFLMGGRLTAIAILPRVRHGRLLMGSVLSALFGCVILYFTQTGFGAFSAVLFLGAGYASVYPLVSEAIGRRFPYYHPGLFNGIFSFAMLGGMLAPATLGYAASQWGVGVVVGIPLLGTCMVMALILAIWLETKVTGR